MKIKFICIIFFIFFLNCKEKTENKTNMRRNYSPDSFTKYRFRLVTADYEFDSRSRIFKIYFCKFSDSIILNENENEKIINFFFENYIDTLRNENFVEPDEPVIMPSFGNTFFIYENDKKKSYINIIGKNFQNEKKLTKTSYNIINFRDGLFSVLNNNADFKKCTDTLKILKKNDTRIFL